MGTSKRTMLAKAMKEARAARAGASSTPAADPVSPPTTSPPAPLTAKAPSNPPPSSPPGPETLPIPNSPPPIAAVPLAAASSPAPTPLDKGKGFWRFYQMMRTQKAWHPSEEENPRGFLFW